MAQGTFRLLPASIKTKQRKYVVKGVLASLGLLLVIWIWAPKHLCIWVAETRVCVDLAHPNLHVLVQHEVHPKYLKVPVTDYVLVVSLNTLSNVTGSVFSDVENLLPKIVLTERGASFSQVRHELFHTDLLSTPNNRLLLEVVLLVVWLGIEAHVGNMNWRIESSTERLVRERVRLSCEQALSVFLDESLER